MHLRKNHFFICLVLSATTIQLLAQNSVDDKVDVLYKRGIELQLQNDSIKAIAQNILTISFQNDYKFGITKAKLLGALNSINNMRLDTARELLNDCEVFFSNNKRYSVSVESGLCYFLQGSRLFRLRSFDSAEYYTNKALTIYEKIESDKNIGSALTQLGIINHLKENRPTALNYYLEGLKFKMKAGLEPKFYRSEISKIAEIYKSMGQYDKALEYAKKALKASDSKRFLAEKNWEIGNIFSDLKLVDSALYYYQTAKKLLTEGVDNSFETVIDYNIARVLTIDGNFVGSNRYLLTMLKKSSSTHKTMERGFQLQIASNYLGLKKYDSALYYGRLVNRSAKQKNVQSEVANVSNILSLSFEALGRYDSALHYSLIYHANKDSIYSIENQRKLSSLYAEIETLGKQKEIEALEKQNLIDKVQNRNLILVIALGSISFISLLISLILFYRNRQKRHILDNLILQQELDKRNKDLHDQALKMIYMNNSFMEIEESLKRLHFQSADSAKDVRQLLSNLQINKSLEKEWDNFNLYFGTVHGNFFDKINADFPELSTSEKRLASLIRMNLTNKEIASILNIESASVKIAKYRLKKKLHLDEETDIHSFFQNL